MGNSGARRNNSENLTIEEKLLLLKHTHFSEKELSEWHDTFTVCLFFVV
jgi:hypothetical protein